MRKRALLPPSLLTAVLFLFFSFPLCAEQTFVAGMQSSHNLGYKSPAPFFEIRIGDHELPYRLDGEVRVNMVSKLQATKGFVLNGRMWIHIDLSGGFWIGPGASTSWLHSEGATSYDKISSAPLIAGGKHWGSLELFGKYFFRERYTNNSLKAWQVGAEARWKRLLNGIRYTGITYIHNPIESRNGNITEVYLGVQL